MSKILITGVSGQDGSYLAEYLLSLGHEVHGIVRRNSVAENQQYRLEKIKNDITVHYGDLLDQTSIEKILTNVKPDYIYNLAAQSHVRISFDIPQFTAQTNAIGVLNILEAYKRLCPDAKFYQASSSEMFGLSVEDDHFQRETTIMNPVSPYGISKVFGYNMVRHYRRAYGLHACNGILFNHECISENTPLILKNKNTGFIEIKRIKDVRKGRVKGKAQEQWLINDKQIWDGDNFVGIKCITATNKLRVVNNVDFNCKIINTRNGVIEVTNHHNMLNIEIEKIKAIDCGIGQELLHKQFPNTLINTKVTEEESMFLGMMVGDGHISEDGRGKFANCNKKYLDIMRDLWLKIGMGTITIDKPRTHKDNNGVTIYAILNSNSNYLKSLRSEIYTNDKFKKIPNKILNAEKNVKLAFLRGYNYADGLKKNPRKYEFKNFKTNSALLAQGLIFLINSTTGQKYNVTFEEDEQYYGYYSINLLSDNNFENKKNEIIKLLDQNISRNNICKLLKTTKSTIKKIENNIDVGRGSYLEKNKFEIKKTLYHKSQPEFVYDIETDSGKFMGGVGNIILSNSPRRGSNFVTSKVVKGACMISLGMQDKLELGNIDSYRDWGYSKDYVRAMELIINHDKADDFVVSTMETRSVREMCDVVFSYLKMDYNDYVIQNPKYMRPEELPYLKGDSTKARTILGWKPTYTFEEIMHEMVDHWMDELQGKKSYR
jgi:GDPmannose 4,6-dehydratase